MLCKKNNEVIVTIDKHTLLDRYQNSKLRFTFIVVVALGLQWIRNTVHLSPLVPRWDSEKNKLHNVYRLCLQII